MQIVLVVLAFIFLLAGLIGSIVPAIPGPPLGYIGLLLLQWSKYGDFSLLFMVIWAVITIGITVLDNFLPALITKRFGGSRMAVIGSVLGLIIGMIFFAPIGLLIGPFFGALIGEMLNNQRRINREKANDPERKLLPEEVQETDAAEAGSKVKALKVAFGAFLAFIVGTGAKLIVGALMIYYAVKAVFRI